MKHQKGFLLLAGLLVTLVAAYLIILSMNQPIPEPTIPLAATEPAPVPTPAKPVAVPLSEPPEPPVIQERFTELLAQNEDVIGWLHIPNTKVDYPVAQSNDNDYYLHRDLNRKKSDPGTLFMDFRNAGDATDRHAIIFGHNMKNGSMFGSLKQYKQKEFYEANRFFTYSTLYEDTQWEIFAAYISPATLKLIQTDFADDAAFMDFIAVRQSKSMYPDDIAVKPTDRILTLITCSYEFPDARFVIHARKVEDSVER